MTSDPIDWTEDVSTNPEQEYRALLKSLRRTRNFGLFFVQCSPVEGERLIQRIRSDLPQKRTEVLTLTATATNLYDEVVALPNKDQIEILFIQGLEHSLYDYEQERLWNEPEQRYSYDESGVPKLLAHLNLSRERFRDHFQMCFVFLVPLFALKYLMRRAPDFFDWRSGVLELAMDAERLEQESQRLWLEGGYEKYLTWTPQQRNVRIMELQSLVEEPQQNNNEHKAALLFEQGNLFYACQNYEAAIASYDQVVVVELDYHQAWNNRGLALSALGRIVEAIASLEKALAINPNDYGAWNNHGLVLSTLGRTAEAIASFEKALAIQPNYDYAWYNKACYYAGLGDLEKAIEILQRAIDLHPDHRKMAKTDTDFDSIRQDARFQALVGSDGDSGKIVG